MIIIAIPFLIIICGFDEGFAKTVVIKICLSFRSTGSSQMLIVLGVSLFSRLEVTDGAFVVLVMVLSDWLFSDRL